MALRGRAVVALVERRGEYYTDVVCDAAPALCMVRATHISPDCQSTLSQCYGVEPSGCREILCCKVAKSCGCAFLMGRALHPM